MTMHFPDLAHQAVADGAIDPAELLALRREGWADGRIGPDEADALVAANDALTERSAEWCAFFVDALTAFVVNGEDPRGYVSDARGEWLITALDRDGRVETTAELE